MITRYLTPELRLRSILDLSVGHLQKLGIRGLLLDVDCTLKDYHATTFRRDIVEWVGAMRVAGLKLCLLSNGRPGRISKLAEILQLPFVAKAFKPSPFGCLRGVRLMDLALNEVAVVGDQLFADILAGRLAGTKTILVRPCTTEEPWFTRLKRPLERQLLSRMPGESLSTCVPEVAVVDPFLELPVPEVQTPSGV